MVNLPTQLKFWRNPIFIALVVAIIIPVAAYLYSLTIKPVKKPQLTQAVKKADYTLAVHNEIKKTFTSSSQKAIIDNINLAKQAKDIQESYDFYVYAFSKMKSAYAETKNKDYLLSMADLRNYVRAYPQYKNSDFTLPE